MGFKAETTVIRRSPEAAMMKQSGAASVNVGGSEIGGSRAAFGLGTSVRDDCSDDVGNAEEEDLEGQ